MGRLVKEIGTSARAAFGETSPHCQCAAQGERETGARRFNRSGRSAAQNTDHLDDETLIAGARTKSQEHLLAISRRKLLSEGVTDVLVERGNQEVVVSTAGNFGARFSEFGYSTLTRDRRRMTISRSRSGRVRKFRASICCGCSRRLRRRFGSNSMPRTAGRPPWFAA